MRAREPILADTVSDLSLRFHLLKESKEPLSLAHDATVCIIVLVTVGQEIPGMLILVIRTMDTI